MACVLGCSVLAQAVIAAQATRELPDLACFAPTARSVDGGRRDGQQGVAPDDGQTSQDHEEQQTGLDAC